MLHYILKQHTEIFMANHKELYFLDDNNSYSKGIDWYKKTYFNDVGEEKAIGELIPAYIYLEHIYERIGGNIKFIFML